MSFLVFLAICAELLGMGAAVLRFFRLHLRLNLSETITASIIIGGLFNYLTVETLGRWNLTPQSIGTAYLIATPLALFGLAAIRHRLSDLYSAWSSIRADKLALIFVGAAAALAVSGFVQAFAPPDTYDTLNYHLFLPQYDVARGIVVPRWDQNSFFSFFPSYFADVTRTSLLFGNDATAQLFNGLFVVLAAAMAANLAASFVAVPWVGGLAALIVLSNRAVAWQFPTLEIDAALGMFAGLAACLFLRLKDDRSWAVEVLLGIVLGSAVLAKYHGFVIALALGGSFGLLHLKEGFPAIRRAVFQLVIVAATSLMVISPHLFRNYFYMGDPLYPLLDQRAAGFAAMYGTGRSLFDFIISPLAIGLTPRAYFDGMMFGAPILLALMPLSAFAGGLKHRISFLWIAVAIYYVIWFYSLSQQVRFLLPILPLLASLAALGVAGVASRVRVPEKAVLFGGLTLLFLVQISFAGIYTLLRVPVALGLISEERFFGTPSFDGTLYDECRYASSRLSERGRILALTDEGLSYCPPLRTDYVLSAIVESRADLAKTPDIGGWMNGARQRDYEFVIVRTSAEMRNADQWVTVPAQSGGPEQLSPWFQRTIDKLQPLATFKHVAIYSGAEFIAGLDELVKSDGRAKPQPR